MASDIIIAVFAAVFAVCMCVWLIVMLCKYADGGEVKNSGRIIALVIGLGVAFRLIFALTVRGYRADYAVFSDMILRLGTDGVGAYYKGNADGALYPAVYFIYLIFGGLSNATGLSDHALGMQFMIKLPMIAADILTAFAVYKTADRYFGRGVALSLFAFVCVCPVFFIGSAVWTSPLVFTAMFVCWACYFLARKNYSATIGFGTAAMFSSKEGVYLFPVVCVFSIFHFVRACKNISASGAKGKELLSKDNRAAITVPAAVAASFVAAYLIGLFMTADYSYNPFTVIYELILYPLVSWTSFTYNGLSVYTLFGQNGAVRGARFPAWVFTCVFGAIVIAVVCAVYFSKRNRATLVMLAAYSLFTVQTYYPGSSAIGPECVLALLALSYALVRDKRLLAVLIATGMAFTVNVVTVLACAGYLNNAGDFALGGVDALLKGGLSAVPIVCSVLTVLAHLFFTVVAVNVGMTGQKKQLEKASGVLGSLKEFVRVERGSDARKN